MESSQLENWNHLSSNKVILNRPALSILDVGVIQTCIGGILYFKVNGLKLSTYRPYVELFSEKILSI
jgi:hypothetical protein